MNVTPTQQYGAWLLLIVAGVFMLVGVFGDIIPFIVIGAGFLGSFFAYCWIQAAGKGDE